MKNKYTNLALGVIILIAVLLFSFLFLRPQLSIIRNKSALVQKQKEQLAKRNKMLENTQAVSMKRSQVMERLDGLQRGYFVPFLHEEIMLRISSLFSKAGLQILTISFYDPERVPFKDNEDSETVSDRASVTSPEQYLEEAKALMEEGLIYKIPEEITDPSYGISRTSMVVMFRSDSTDNLKAFLTDILAKQPEIRIAALELSNDQSAWLGHMTLHFYQLPSFMWITEE